MTEKVERYNGLEQDDEGVYVLYSDYAILLDRLNIARKEELVARIRVENLEANCEVLRDLVESLSDRNQRLREALERVRGFCEPEPWPSGPPITLCFLHDIVDAALKETGDDG